MPYIPLECRVFEQNYQQCEQFWDRVADRYRSENVFEERSGYPDKKAFQVITTELEKQDSMPYSVSAFQTRINFFVEISETTIQIRNDFWNSYVCTTMKNWPNPIFSVSPMPTSKNLKRWTSLWIKLRRTLHLNLFIITLVFTVRD